MAAASLTSPYFTNLTSQFHFASTRGDFRVRKNCVLGSGYLVKRNISGGRRLGYLGNGIKCFDGDGGDKEEGKLNSSEKTDRELGASADLKKEEQPPASVSYRVK